ncbi:MAG: ribonuclease H family protein [Firmicutes bacterium]|nr:ribonuclease H family protein [Bacillota bacterium]
MAKKYHAVRRGFRAGIYTTWSDCKRQITGFMGAEYKTFPSLKGAQGYLNKIDITMEKDIIPRIKKGGAVAFSDGSYIPELGAYGCGAVVFMQNGYGELELKEISFAEKNSKIIQDTSIAGEIRAAMKAISYCAKKGFDKMTLFYDLELITQIVKNPHLKISCESAKMFRTFVKDAKKRIKIEFFQIKGHNNIEYHDYADALAKQALLASCTNCPEHKKVSVRLKNEKYRNSIEKQLSGIDKRKLQRIHTEDEVLEETPLKINEIARINDSEMEMLIIAVKTLRKDIACERVETRGATTWKMLSETDKLTIVFYKTKEMIMRGKASELSEYVAQNFEMIKEFRKAKVMPEHTV